MTDDAVEVLYEAPIVHLRMNRPEKLNAITLDMYDRLSDELRAADADPNICAVVLSGAGRAFTAGNDLTEFLVDPDTGPESPVLRFLDTLMTVEVPLVAAVQGEAVGIGTTLLLHADIVIADPTAIFSTPFATLGLVPEAGSSVLLPRMVGPRLASRMLMLSERIPAQEALAHGLVTEIVGVGDHERIAIARARQLALVPREPLRVTKRLLRDTADSVPERAAIEARLFAERLESSEFREAAERLLHRAG